MTAAAGIRPVQPCTPCWPAVMAALKACWFIAMTASRALSYWVKAQFELPWA